MTVPLGSETGPGTRGRTGTALSAASGNSRPTVMTTDWGTEGARTPGLSARPSPSWSWTGTATCAGTGNSDGARS
eukprot:5140754-Heterocapsa_arctica.AAC.1